jgi:thiol-disulfide isomerase/thioredoxin
MELQPATSIPSLRNWPVRAHVKPLPSTTMTDHIDHERRRLIGAGALAVAGVRLGMYDSVARSTGHAGVQDLNRLDALRGATAWLNSSPITRTEPRGKVVLLDVCTYTCINWLRTLPYVRAWSEKYRSSGLIVVGVHSPEFTFEHDLDNVRRAAKQLPVEYPLAIDNAFAVWRALGNRYWPSLYLIDPDGEVRYRHFGEGDYEQSERNIQRQLRMAGARDVDSSLVTVEGQGVQAAPDWGNLRSPENYVGHGRTQGFVSPGGVAPDEVRNYVLPAQFRRNEWGLSGQWTMNEQAAVLRQSGGRISYRFHARDLHLVLGPAVRGIPIPFRVRMDGQPPAAARGTDVDEQGNGIVTDARLYQLIRQPKPINDRQFDIEFLGAGVEAFAFTFG